MPRSIFSSITSPLMIVGSFLLERACSKPNFKYRCYLPTLPLHRIHRCYIHLYAYSTTAMWWRWHADRVWFSILTLERGSVSLGSLSCLRVRSSQSMSLPRCRSASAQFLCHSGLAGPCRSMPLYPFISIIHPIQVPRAPETRHQWYFITFTSTIYPWSSAWRAHMLRVWYICLHLAYCKYLKCIYIFVCIYPP